MKDFLQTGGSQSARKAGEMATRIMKGPHLPLPAPQGWAERFPLALAGK